MEPAAGMSSAVVHRSKAGERLPPIMEPDSGIPEFPLDYEPFPSRTEISLSHLLRNTQQIWNTVAMDGLP